MLICAATNSESVHSGIQRRILLHKLDDFVCVRNSAVCEQINVCLLILVLFRQIEDCLERTEDICPAIIRFKCIYLVECRL